MGGFSSSSESPVGVVVDGVVSGLGQGVDSLGDVERVEVLKGRFTSYQAACHGAADAAQCSGALVNGRPR